MKNNKFDNKYSIINLDLCFLLAIISCYFINRSQDFKIYAIYFDSLIALFMALLIIFNFFKYPIPKNIFICYVLLVITSFFTIIRGEFNIHWLYTIICIEIIRLNYIPSKNIIIIIYLALFFSIYQFNENIFIDGRHVLSIFDPNYSSYYILILALIFYIFDKKYIFYGLIIAGFFLLSRAYFLSILILLFSLIFLRSAKIKKSINLILISTIFIPILLSLLILAINVKAEIIYDSSYARLFNYFDQSNMDRALANIYFLKYIFANPHVLFSGVDISFYTSNIYHNSPHVSYYQIIFNYGILYFFAVINILFVMRDKILVTNFNCIIILSLIPWILFLGGVLYGPQLILLGVIFSSGNKINSKCIGIS